MGLTPKQQAFVDAYTGNGVEAARAAGYAGDAKTLAVTASRLLADAKVADAIARRNAVVQQVRSEAAAVAGRIATRAERQAFWTQVMCNEKHRTADRLKAAELLGKSEADFVERLQHEGKLTLEQLVLASQKPEGS